MSAQTLDIVLEKATEIISFDPATGEELGRAPLASAEEVMAAVRRARAAQAAWSQQSYSARAATIMRARRIILDEVEEIALLVSRETGKPIAEAISMELAPTLDLMRFFARRTKHLLRAEKIDIGQYGLMGRTSRIRYKPLGTIGIISPWNFPWAIPLGEVVMALMAGNAVVLKPSELTPLVGLKIADVFKRAGLADGMLQVITGDGATGAALVEAGVDKIMFTGSVATGKRVAQSAAKRLTPVVLELGGKDPMIVTEDADVDTAAAAAVWGAFSNSGQACASVERCYVHESIAPQFIKSVVEKTLALKQSLGTTEDTDIGSMSSERQVAIVEEHVNDAVKRGANVLVGGRRARLLKGAFYEPTVITDVDHTMTIMREETFGPVLPVMTFKTETQAIGLANDSVFGLTASVWTKDARRGKRIAELLEAGTVMVNEVLYTHGIAQTPWGGMKQSGLGRTHGRLGLLELVAPQHVHINHIARLHDFWWFSYSPRAGRLFRGFARRFATGNVLQTSLLLPQMVRRLFERRAKAKGKDEG
jgi:succinate-semialdehyde dehydrogenase/glutarate-semialdehyde dehydrogenase